MIKSIIETIERRVCAKCTNLLSGTFKMGPLKQPSQQPACFLCLGLLDPIVQKRFEQQLVDSLQKFSSPTFNLSLRLCFYTRFRESLLERCFLEAFPDSVAPQIVGMVKTAFKDIYLDVIAKKLNSRVDHKSKFIVVIKGKCQIKENDMKELFSIYKNKMKKNLKFKTDEVESISAGEIEKILSDCSESELIRFIQEQVVDHSDFSMEFQTPPVFIAGRYLKLCRTIPQTPWFDKKSRIVECSVQEIITAPIKEILDHKDISFLSSGREDSDVLMLGKGRPFVLTLNNILNSNLPHALELQKSINASTNLIKVRDLQYKEESEDSLRRMKEGEMSKMKLYTAYCLCRSSAITEADFDLMNSIQNLKIIQRTPLRVLHRRSLVDRTRQIYSMNAEKLTDNCFILRLKTQAGTYIKEFIHSDIGRTEPSLSSLLDKSIDIMFLDVDVS
ncbi:hypothetical protein ACOME3_002285 [Neoechinorhynchus agilis]